MYERYRLGDIKNQLAGTMSGGQRQRLALAGAVLHKPELLLLDEPTSAVDPQSRRDFWDALFDLSEGGTTLLVSTHYMDEAERCHRLAILDRGRLVADGTPQALMDRLPGSTLRIASAAPRRMQKALAGDAHVLGAAQIGSDLRVLVDRRDDDAGWLRDRVHAIDPAAQVEPVAPNLEDVFVASTRRGRRDPETDA
jgi:ABC-2 type transport system ATP-binding protein